MPDAAIYRRLSNDLVKRAIKTDDQAERARLVSMAEDALARAFEVGGAALVPRSAKRKLT
jgi:hypothetical protein